MHFAAIAATLSLACLASASVDIVLPTPPLSSDVTKRGLLDSTLSERQAGPGQKTVQIVTVGDNNGTLKFFPENIQAEVGSIVQFQFYPKNHTITESSFAAPCMPMAANLTSPTRPGQRSGFVPVSADTQFRPVYNMLINDTKPIWIFCGQAPHCQKGMAMVVNQNMSSPDKTLEKYKAAAAQLPLPGAPSSSASASASGFATTSVVSSSASTTAVAVTTTTSAAGPSLAGASTTSAATASIATFTGNAPLGKGMPVGWGIGLVGLLAVAL
ncbi:hypothetical protein H2198_000048 [Neophaeococcomyces mojaviensis]|uniref:Uncharacterized protein n=1 Tax=Neophaeococcomyces mojaviensis TaxID=3383035 RepID=A0ACC3AKV3_9EURO|nr:hypothetical protein H2198_000048 [Knufia sp. JES_112]